MQIYDAPIGPKLPYSKPVLYEFGTLAQMTKMLAGGGAMDGGTGGGQNRTGH